MTQHAVENQTSVVRYHIQALSRSLERARSVRPANFLTGKLERIREDDDRRLGSLPWLAEILSDVWSHVKIMTVSRSCGITRFSSFQLAITFEHNTFGLLLEAKHGRPSGSVHLQATIMRLMPSLRSSEKELSCNSLGLVDRVQIQCVETWTKRSDTLSVFCRCAGPNADIIPRISAVLGSLSGHHPQAKGLIFRPRNMSFVVTYPHFRIRRIRNRTSGIKTPSSVHRA
jgi:hypothetical protein